MPRKPSKRKHTSAARSNQGPDPRQPQAERLNQLEQQRIQNRAFVRDLAEASDRQAFVEIARRFSNWSNCKIHEIIEDWGDPTPKELQEALSTQSSGYFVGTSPTDFKQLGITGAAQIAWAWIPTDPPPDSLLITWNESKTTDEDRDNVADSLQQAAFAITAVDPVFNVRFRFRRQLKELGDSRNKLCEDVLPMLESADNALRNLRTRAANAASSARESEKAFGDTEFQEFVDEVFQTVFDKALANPKLEHELHAGLKRIDIVYRNAGREGLFFDLSVRHLIKCPYVFVECKNLSYDPKNPEIDQLLGRFAEGRGRFGFLVCYRISDRGRSRLLERCREAARDRRGWIIALDIDDLVAMLDAKVIEEDLLWNFLDEHFRLLTF